jgi:hypothetical protein
MNEKLTLVLASSRLHGARVDSGDACRAIVAGAKKQARATKPVPPTSTSESERGDKRAQHTTHRSDTSSACLHSSARHCCRSRSVLSPRAPATEASPQVRGRQAVTSALWAYPASSHTAAVVSTLRQYPILCHD